ncbi:MAG: hypothetical protein PVI75_09030 [Gammaproteobacteria bacterium]|jgi:hypothetical protein
MNEDTRKQEQKGNGVSPYVSDSIINDLEARLYSLSLKHKEIKVGDFKNLTEVKDIITTISVLEKYYR